MRGAELRRGPHRVTPLQQYLDDHDIPAAQVEAVLRARLEGRAPSRRQLLRWRLGRVEPQRKQMVRILWAIRELSRNPSLTIEAIFDFEPGNEENWRD